MLRRLCQQLRHEGHRLPATRTKVMTRQWTKTMSTATNVMIPELVQERKTVSSILERLNETQSLKNSTGHELLGYYATKGQWQEAQQVYDEVFRYASSSNTDDVRSTMETYGLLMEAYIRGNSVDEAIDIYYSLKDYVDLHPVAAQQKGLEFSIGLYTQLITALSNSTSITNGSNNNNDDMTSPHLGYTVDDGAHEIMNLEKDCSSELRMAMILFQDMRQQGLQAEPAIYLALLKRCGQEQDGYLLRQVHQYLRMDDGIEMDHAMVYGLMEAYRKVGDEDAMVFEIWENIGGIEFVDFVLDMCREKKYKLHATRVWEQLSTEEKTKSSYRHMVSCLLEANEWHQAKQLVLEMNGNDTLGYSELVNLLIDYGNKQGIQPNEWKNLGIE